MQLIDINIQSFQTDLVNLINNYVDKLTPGICLLIVQKILRQIELQYIANLNTYYILHPVREKKLTKEKNSVISLDEAN